MKKVVKLKQSDITNIVTNIIEQHDDFSNQGKVVPIGDFQKKDNDGLSEYETKGGVPLQVGRDEDGNYVILRNVNGKPVIVAQVKGNQSQVRQAAE